MAFAVNSCLLSFEAFAAIVTFERLRPRVWLHSKSKFASNNYVVSYHNVIIYGSIFRYEKP